MPFPTRSGPLPKRSFLNYLITFNLLIVFLILGYAFGVLSEAKETFYLKGIPRYRLYGQLWMINQAFGLLFLLPGLAFITVLEHFYGTVIFTLLRFLHLAVNLKQAILPELPEDLLIRQELSRIYSPDYVHLNLLFNSILFFLLLLFIFKLYRRRRAALSPEPTPSGITLA